MSDLFVVILDTGLDPIVYGPTEDEDTARDFAAFMTREVDPATVHKLHSPTRELLAFWKEKTK
jgi:hypothetical protein